MPMSLTAQYFYFLLIVLMYGSPITLIVLFWAWRKKHLAKASLGLMAANLAIAGLAVVGFHSGMQRSADNYQAESESIDEYVGDPLEVSVVIGRYVGIERHANIEFSYYQFEALDGSDRILELIVPPPRMTAAAFIRHGSRFKPAIEDARLVVWPRRIEMNPSLEPELFFERHVPGETAHSFGEHTLITGLRPRSSIVIYPAQANAETWRWQMAVLEL